MDADTKKSVAAWSSVVWSGLLALVKLVVGIVTGSLGILSEALHSALDLVAAGGTVFAVKVAAVASRSRVSPRAMRFSTFPWP